MCACANACARVCAKILPQFVLWGHLRAVQDYHVNGEDEKAQIKVLTKEQAMQEAGQGVPEAAGSVRGREVYQR